jgi:hypothetical protein
MEQEGQPVCRTELVRDTISEVQHMQRALEAARLLCANLDNGGTGHQALVNHFRELDDLTKSA